MEKGYSTRNSSSVLKLVHPGCFIEKYTKPITAAEVMRRHPRHCVARPDVFRNPWIVVRPESVLLPGNVFYVVSFHTLHHLMRSMPDPTNKAVEGSSQSFVDMADFRRLGKGRPGQATSAEMTNSIKTAVEQLIRKRTSKEGYFGQDTSSRYCEETRDGSARSHRVRKRMINDAVLSAKQSDKSEVNHPVNKCLDRSSIGNSFSSIDHRYCDRSDNATELKSCLKKQKRELNHLRVRFKLPSDEDKIEMNETQKTTSTFI